MAKVDVYASSVARCVFIWITLVIFIIGFIWNYIIQRQLSSGIGQAFDVVQDVGITAVGFVPGYGTAISIGASALKWFKQNGGKALMAVSGLLILVYEAFWNPWRHLKDATITYPEKKDKKD